jgi:hypothetical protein
LRKASRWNNAIVVALLLLLCAPLIAQDESPVGVLLTAPVLERGIDWLPANTIPYWFATYRASLTERVQDLAIYYVEGPVEEVRDWPVAACRFRRLLESGDGHYYYESTDDWSVFVTAVFADEPLRSVPCEFFDLFLTRLVFFQTLRTSAPVFPAILGTTR